MDTATLVRIADEELARVERALGDRAPAVSDLVDDAGHQYVDLVMEGGFYRAMALVGYIYALEHFGIRFLSIAGTSSGANIATLLAAAGRPHERRSQRVLEKVVAFRPGHALDRGTRSQARLADWLTAVPANEARSRIARARHVLCGIGAGVACVPALLWHLGVFPGDALQAWCERALGEFGITRTDQLRQRMQPDTHAPVRPRAGTVADRAPANRPLAKLCIVATDLSTERRVELPDDGALYFEDSDAVHPAVWVRASLSLPLVYRPVVCRPPYASARAWSERWGEDAGRASPPSRCLLVDGGVIANFPIDVFHEHGREPPCPTVGVRVSPAARYTEVRGVGSLVRQMFETARRAGEAAFHARHRDYKHLVETVDTRAIGGSAFTLSDAQSESLFRNGIRAAGRWLGRFDWERYQRVRAGEA
jgi:NTE family protein